jgi:hypothetical protein
MMGWAIGWQELLVVLVLFVLPGIAGLVLFIVGLSLKKPALWGLGLGLMALVFLILAGGLALLLLP